MAVASLATLSVAPIPSLSDEINQIRLDTAKIVSELIIPQEEVLGGQTTVEARDSLYYELQQHVKSSNLWAPHLPKEYGGMGISQAKKLKEVETENARLKRLVADLSLDNAILKEVLGKK